MAAKPTWADETVARAANATNGYLGNPVSSHWRTLHTRAAMWTYVLPVAIGLAALCCGVPAVLTNDDKSPVVPIAVAGVVALAIGAVFSVVTKPKGRVGVVLFERGIVYVENDKVDPMSFADIDSVRRKVIQYFDTNMNPSKRKRPTHRIVISRVNRDDVLVNDQFHGVAELGDRLVLEVNQLKMPEAMYRINSGETLRFGPFSVDRYGINNGRDTLPWGEVEDVKVVEGYLTVRQRGKWLRWSRQEVGDIPNFSVLLGMAEHLRPAVGGPGR